MCKFCFKALWKIIYYSCYCVFAIGKGLCRFLVWLMLGSSKKARTKSISQNNNTSTADILLLPDDKNPVELPEPQQPPAMVKVGEALSVDQDHNLRNFTIFNAEGEAYQIDTRQKGLFYGPVWTHVLECYQTRQTLRARITQVLYGKSGHRAGYRVKIGKIKAFLPHYHAMRDDLEQPVNTRVAITYIDPVSRRVTVSVRLAYQLLFDAKPVPAINEEIEALYWDYDENYLYLLLPGEYMGKFAYRGEQVATAALIGTLTQCRVEEINEDERESVVTVPTLTNFQINSKEETNEQRGSATVLSGAQSNGDVFGSG